jgi:hypothetical protein
VHLHQTKHPTLHPIPSLLCGYTSTGTQLPNFWLHKTLNRGKQWAVAKWHPSEDNGSRGFCESDALDGYTQIYNYERNMRSILLEENKLWCDNLVPHLPVCPKIQNFQHKTTQSKHGIRGNAGVGNPTNNAIREPRIK